MRTKIKENKNGVKRFKFVSEELVPGRSIEVVGIKDKDSKNYQVVFYDKTFKRFYGYLTISAKELEGKKNVVSEPTKEG